MAGKSDPEPSPRPRWAWRSGLPLTFPPGMSPSEPQPTSMATGPQLPSCWPLRVRCPGTAPGLLCVLVTVVTERTAQSTWTGTGPEPQVTGTKPEAHGSWGRKDGEHREMAGAGCPRDREVQGSSLQEWARSHPQASCVPPCDRDKGLEAPTWGMVSRPGHQGSAGELKPRLLGGSMGRAAQGHSGDSS